MPRIDGHRFPHPVHPTQTLKDRNETNFGSFSRTRCNRLRCNLRNRRKAWKKRLAYQLLWIVLIVEQVLRRSRQVLWKQGIPSGCQIWRYRRRAWRLPVRFEPSRLYQPQHDCYLQVTTRSAMPSSESTAWQGNQADIESGTVRSSSHSRAAPTSSGLKRSRTIA